ncbi:MAG TPA: hypothetical protein VGZ02_06085 [Candidatus Baltobacteraceae bacterium]|nr:hypothetical protein [Candidatus Baltobacteraceae bacterium]
MPAPLAEARLPRIIIIILGIAQHIMRKSTDELWQRLKTEAQEYAASDRPLPDDGECAETVARVVKEMMGSIDAISSEALEFYSTELCAMAEDLRKQQSARR